MCGINERELSYCASFRIERPPVKKYNIYQYGSLVESRCCGHGCQFWDRFRLLQGSGGQGHGRRGVGPSGGALEGAEGIPAGGSTGPLPWPKV